MATGWTLWQFDRIVGEFCQQVDGRVWEQVEFRLDTLRRLGNLTSWPVSEPLEDGLFALRAHYKTVQVRMIYYFGRAKQIVIVVVIASKKQRKIPREAIDLAKVRRKQIEQERERLHEFTVEVPTDIAH